VRDTILRAAVRGILGTGPLVRALGASRRRRAPTLDPQVAAVLALERLARVPSLDSLSPADARRTAAEGLSALDPDVAAMARVIDTTVPGPAGALAVRTFVPVDATPHWIVYFHGGGGVIGSVASSERATRLVAARARCTVASVEYRLGPEHPHPAAIDDAVAAFAALAADVPARARVAVAGDSFGGYLATCVDRAARAAGTRRPDAQGLLYPITDYTMSSPSLDRNADGYIMTRSLIAWFRTHYAGSDADLHAMSPAFWLDDALRGAAPAAIATAEFDPLVDEGDAYAARLARLGVPVRHRRVAGLIHGFVSMTGAVRAARAATDAFCDDLAALLAG